MVQKGIMDAKINKFVDREEIMGENLTILFRILHWQCTEILVTNLGGYINYESIDRDQYLIGILKLVKGFMFKFVENKEQTHVIWEAYVSMF